MSSLVELTGGFNARTRESHGPQNDYLSVIFQISGVGKSLPVTWNTHGPGYSSDRLFINSAIPAKLVTAMWVYNKKCNNFVDATKLWENMQSK